MGHLADGLIEYFQYNTARLYSGETVDCFQLFESGLVVTALVV